MESPLEQPAAPPRPPAKARRVRGRLLAGAVVLAAIAAAATLVAVAYAGPAGPAVGPAVGSADGPVARAHAAALAEATHLLDLLAPPPGSRPVASLPYGGPGGSLDSHAIDRHRDWVVRMPFAAAAGNVAARPPAHVGRDDTGTTWGPGELIDYDTWAATSSRDWVEAQAGWMVIRLAHGEVGLRADGQDVWVDPIPARDTRPGPRRHLSVTSACPRRLDDVANPGFDLARRLVPAGRPSRGLVCWAGHAGGSGRETAVRQVLDGEQAAAVAAAAAQLPLGTIGSYAVSCPAASGATAVVVLAYPGRGDVDLFWLDGGCQALDNGQIDAGDAAPVAGLAPLRVPARFGPP